MLKREMCIVKYIGPAPYVAVCRQCGQKFEVSPDITLTAVEAEAKLQAEFSRHDCEPLDES